MQYILYDNDGNIDSWLQCSPDFLQAQSHNGLNYIEVDENLPITEGKVINGAFVPDSPKEKTEEEKWQDIKYERKQRLDETDWIIIQAQEAGTPVRQVWLDYRQYLRDIPEMFENADDVVWPIAPE